MWNLSGTPQCSTILPFSKRQMSITSTVTFLPVAGRPISSPPCVPRPVARTHTSSPTATILSMVNVKSGKSL